MTFHFRLLVISICVFVAGCGSSETDSDVVNKMVYVDTETMAAIVLPVYESLPATNSETGERTLMPGLYCPECRTWYPVPAPDQINRRPDAALCPKTRTPLIADGPWPDEDSESTEGVP